MRMNINHIMQVHLTDAGLAIYQKYHNDLGFPLKEVSQHIELPLWEFANIFGQHMYMGQTADLFVDNSITTK